MCVCQPGTAIESLMEYEGAGADTTAHPFVTSGEESSIIERNCLGKGSFYQEMT